ncbi:hypothetical protein H6P81_002273 [Aristolochia fimbriata]|uniref:F-box domain-containing protein n=1 Tax=Aristolochia fimbriata TaxID=158543 RepID=A0AAV7FC60_ARIFI|nr:hypothetical protein H6P81_002273 [Aristolochia fimbriata]
MTSCGLPSWTFPDDVLIQILSRLPAKSILRCRAVCKHWRELTSSKYFIQLFNEISSNDQMILVETVILVDSTSSFVCIDKSSSISEFSLSFLNDRVKVRASCNGLLCCSSIPNRGVYYVCNPITRKFRTLYRATERPVSRFHPDAEATLVGLAVYPDYGRFKVVLADFYRPFGCRPFDSLLCHVFDSEASSWRRFYTTLNDEFTHMNKNQVVFANDSLHWLTKWSRYVLVLDLDNEAWSKIRLPHEIVNVLDTKIYLLELEGSLSVVQILKNYMITWILNSYVKEEWVVKDTVSLSCIEILVPTTFPISQTKDFVFLATHRQRWTRTITREIVFDENTVELRPNLDEVVHIRRNDLASKIHKVLDVDFKSEEALSFLEKKIDVICDEIGQFEPDYGTKMRMPQEIHVHPPDIAKTKGSGKRLKGGKEKAMEQTAKKLRLCHGCGARGEHDKRNCPKLRDIDSQFQDLKEILPLQTLTKKMSKEGARLNRTEAKRSCLARTAATAPTNMLMPHKIDKESAHLKMTMINLNESMLYAFHCLHETTFEWSFFSTLLLDEAHNEFTGISISRTSPQILVKWNIEEKEGHRGRSLRVDP